jgi:hypothetical protein
MTDDLMMIIDMVASMVLKQVMSEEEKAGED